MLHKVMLFLFFCLLALGVTYGYYYSRWKRLGTDEAGNRKRQGGCPRGLQAQEAYPQRPSPFPACQRKR